MDRLVVKNISCAYDDVTVVDSVNINVSAKEIVCLLGPSGCGKSTLLRLIAGLEDVQSGSVQINGKTVEGDGVFIQPEKRHIGMVFQNPSLFPHLNIEKNVAFGLKNKSEKERIVAERMKAVGMEDSCKKFPYMLSGGEQQRIALARALAIEPEIMLLDEPFANLDTTLRKKIRKETAFLLKSLDIATLLVTHDPEEALRMADRIYVMQKGKIIQSGTPRELYSSPVNSFIAEFFGELNKLKVEINEGKAVTPFGIVENLHIEQGKTTVFIRPESIYISDDEKDSVCAIVEMVQFLGLTNIIYIKLKKEGINLRMRTSRPQLPKEGDEICVKLNTSNMLIFDE